MGRYLRGKGKLQSKPWEGFKNPVHMLEAVARSKADDPHWEAVRRIAQDYLDGRKTPKFKLRRNDLLKITHHSPHKISKALMHDLARARRQKKKGAGLWDAISAVWSEAAHLVGADALWDALGMYTPTLSISDQQQEIAGALQQAYKPMGERKDSVGGMQRLSSYDTDQISVWQQENGELLVTVRGTKMNASDIGNDAQILAGGEVRSPELESLLQQLNTEGQKYSLAGHSLATQFIVNSKMDGIAQADNYYLFNPASSPFQGSSYLQKEANDPDYTYFLNRADLVSKGLYQKMTNDTLKNVVTSPWTWDPVSCHVLGQWVADTPEGEEPREPEEDEMAEVSPSLRASFEAEVETEQEEAEEAAEQQGVEARKSGWTVNFNK